MRDIAEDGDRAQEVILQNNWRKMHENNLTILQVYLFRKSVTLLIGCRRLRPVMNGLHPWAC